MKKITGFDVLKSSAFLKIAFEEAIKTIARINGQTVEVTEAAYKLQVPNVMMNVTKLIATAADDYAKRVNEENAKQKGV
jgi:hypothetical protein